MPPWISNVCLILPIILQAPDAAEVSRQSKALVVTFITQTFIILASLLQGDGVEFLSEVSLFLLIHPCIGVASFLFLYSSFGQHASFHFLCQCGWPCITNIPNI